MFEYHKNNINEINSIPNNLSVEENLYYRDYYLKDFKYISPDVINLNKIKVINKDVEKTVLNEELEPKSMLKKWVGEVMKGLKQFFYRGSLHGVNARQAPPGAQRPGAPHPLHPLVKTALLKKWVGEVMKALKQFFYQGSLHGVKYIFEPTFGRKEKATWIVIMFISIFICAVVIIQLFCKWTSTPFVNVIDSVPTPIWAVPFPTVVICPHLHVKMSYANVSELEGLQEFFAAMVCPRMNTQNKFRSARLNDLQSHKLTEFLVQGAPTCPEVVKACNWPALHDTRWEMDKCCELFQPIFTNYGLCFAFNSLPLSAMNNDTLAWHKTFDVDAKPAALQWGLDIGYPKVFPPDLKMKPLRVMASGEANGLGVELFLNNTEHQYACEGKSLGFTILISSPTDHVYTSTVLRLPMDRMTTIEVTPLTYKTDFSLKALSPYRRQCYFQSEKKLQYYEFYTDSNCKHDLLVQEARKMCNCVLYNWPRKFIWEPVCTTKYDFKCISKVEAKVEEQLIYAYYAESEDERGTTQEAQSCHPSCNDVIYASQVFYSDLNKETENTSHKWGQLRMGEVTQINVHFYDDMFLGQHRHAQYDDYYFIGAIGGLLSLFLGFSIISVAELIYFVLLKPVYAIFIEANQP